MNNYVVTINNRKKTVSFPGTSKVLLDNKEFTYEIAGLTGNYCLLRLGSKVFRFSYEKISSTDFNITLNDRIFIASVHSSLEEKASQISENTFSPGHKRDIKAPMPGVILRIRKNRGEVISAGEPVITLEAMKMENDIKSPSSGRLLDILVTEGNIVEKGKLLFSIEAV